MSICKLTPRAIKDAVMGQLREALGEGTQIYEDLVPRDFQRPAVLVELTGGAMLPLAGGRNTVPLQWSVRLTGLVESDQVNQSHLGPLDDLGWLLQSMWAGGYLKVADRALHLDKVQLDTGGYDNVVVSLTMSITVERRELLVRPPEPVGTMEDVAIRPGTTVIK